MSFRAIGVVVLGLTALPAAARDLTFDDRVRYQRAIEDVYWKHRIWPAENPAPKPALSEVMTDAATRQTVEDDLKKAKALEVLWQRPITADQLQAELDRLVRETRDGATLSEIFAALGNDPETIAQSFARPVLVDRLLRDWYAHDSRFHGALRQRAEAALSGCGDATCMREMGGTYTETTYGPEQHSKRFPNDRVVRLEPADLTTVRGTFKTPIGRVGAIEETWDSFTVRALIAEDGDGFTTATVTWPKESFNTWWEGRRASLPAEVAVPSGSYTVRSIQLGGCTPDTWAPTYIGAPDPRSGHTAVWTGTEMLVYGGGSPVGGRYNAATNTWTQLNAGAGNPSPRTAHTAVWTGTEMIVWGGQSVDGQATSFADGARYNPSSDTWTPLPSTDAPNARFGHAAVWTGSLMIVWGGTGGGVAGGRYNPSTNTWTAMSVSGVPGTRAGVTGVWTGTVAIFWGGSNGGGDLNTGGRYNPANDSWVGTTTTGAPTARQAHTAVWTGSEMIVWGGSSGAALTNTGSRYNPLTDTWSATTTLAPVPALRYRHSAVWTGTRMIIWGGTTTGPAVQTGGIYDPSANGWVATPTTANVPSARELHTAVWTGSEMLIWGGGVFGGSPVNTGGRFSVATNSWAPISSGTFVPAARYSHSAVWNGSEMIVWGGFGTGYLNTGGRYNLATNTWTPTAISGTTPLPRASHTAVWTGLNMFVWGGEDGSQVLNTGGRYDAFADTWTATSLTGAPTARQYHTAVLANSEVIVWGGGNLSLSPVNTGGRYNPVSNTWSATPTTGAPVARLAHVALWTGDSMIVWGGADSTLFGVNSGAIYVPSSGNWVPISQGPNVPSGRFWPAATYTGGELVIWGGGGINDSTGGRYFLPLNQWNPTSTIGAPSAREVMSFVWTGDKLVVWGGQNRFPPTVPALGTGGRYKYQLNTWSPTSVLGSVPSARAWHTGVWTGSQMVVWGGLPLTTTGGIYCADECVSPNTYYLDADGDTYGTFLSEVQACSLPPGYSASNTDCNDANANINPGAIEACNGVDLNCDGVGDTQSPPEINFGQVTRQSFNVAQYPWSTFPGARYDAMRGIYVGAVGTDPFNEYCLYNNVTATSWTDDGIPQSGQMFWFLVRAVNSCDDGTWGFQTNHATPTTERAPSAQCP